MNVGLISIQLVSERPLMLDTLVRKCASGTDHFREEQYFPPGVDERRGELDSETRQQSAIIEQSDKTSAGQNPRASSLTGNDLSRNFPT